MTIWFMSIGNAGMDPLLLTNLSSQRIAAALMAAVPTPPQLVPAGETDDGPRQVPDFAERARHSQLRAQRRIFTGFPLNRPRPAIASK
jgi:hypothetical protein